MKKFTLFIVVSFLMSGCSYFKETIKLKDVLKEKEHIDNSDNPAKKYFLQLELSEKLVELNNILVKDVTTSTNIDFDFCIIADIEIDGKKIECYIYSKNIRSIAMLKKGISVINVKGEFGRFFSMLDDYYTKIEIINSKIDIIEKTNIKTEKKTSDLKNGQKNANSDKNKKEIKENKDLKENKTTK